MVTTPLGRLNLVTGPARSGKSEWAETLAAQSGKPVIYVATSQVDPEDREWQARIQQHRRRRPKHWTTLQVPIELSTTIQQASETSCLLIDSLGTWLANILAQDEAAWNNTLQILLQSLQQAHCTVILVAEETGWGMVPAYPIGRTFRDRLGTLVRQIGAVANPVYLVTGGHVINLSALGSPFVYARAVSSILKFRTSFGQAMLASTASHKIIWEKLPDDFVLPDEPVDNINQPSLAAALTESLEIAGRLPENALTVTNYGICATVNGKIVVKAPDWGYVPAISVSREEVRRSYTPQLQGEVPVIVMEFLSNTEGGEYSIKPTYPPGKWFFYERILQVPSYVIFEPEAGDLEVYQLDDSKQYRLQAPDDSSRYWIAAMNLFLGMWQGIRENRTGYWLRWWNERGELLLWGSELAEQERQRAEQERQRAERLAVQLRAAGIEPEL